MTAPLGNPFTLGATGVTTTTRFDRLALGASFRPGAAALSAASGFLVGPAGTMGDLTLLTDVLLRVDPFLAVVQGTHNTQQGQYLVPNVQSRDLAVPAKDASLFRRALVVVRVADSLEAGVASSATTDGAWLEIVSGTLAASNPALPAVPANALLAGELSIPSTASGQPVTLTKYNPRTVSRGGVLPVASTDTAAPAHDGAYRDHPTFGLQRGAGGVWGSPVMQAGRGEFGPWDSATNGTPSASVWGPGVIPAVANAVAPNPVSTGSPAGDRITFPAGVWLVEWITQTIGAQMSGRSFHNLVRDSDAFRYSRESLTSGGNEDVSSTQHILLLPASTVIKFEGYYTTTVSPFTQRNTIRAVQLSSW